MAENLPALPHHSMSGRICPLSLTLSTLLRQSTAGLPVAARRSRIHDSASGQLGRRRQRRGALVRLDDDQHRVHVLDGPHRLAHHEAVERRARQVHARRVHEDDLPVGRRPAPRGSSMARVASPFHTPTMRLRVVCGLGVTMASFSPTMALSRVDLPTLGRPMMATVPAMRRASSPAASGLRVGSDTGGLV